MEKREFYTVVKTLLMQDENGQVTEPYSISAGLDYPGIGPLHAHLSDQTGVYILVLRMMRQ